MINSKIEDLTLPFIQIEEINKDLNTRFVTQGGVILKNREINFKNKDGEIIGVVILDIEKHSDNKNIARISKFNLNENFYNENYDLAAYLELIRYFNDSELRSGFHLNARNIEIWEWLVANAKAKKGTFIDPKREFSAIEYVGIN